MKATVLLVVVACLHVSAGTVAQKITLSGNNMPLEKVFQQIRQQTGYQFFYRDDLVKKASPVSINVKNASIEEALQQCFADLPLSYTIVEKTIIIKAAAKQILLADIIPPPPPIEVEGIITDESGNPVANASIMVKGTKYGVTSDANGRFKLTSSQQEVTLVISYVGHEPQEVKVKGSQSITVKLTPVVTENTEVVVVGYGTQKKTNLTGSVGTVNTKQIESRPVANVVAALQGESPGLVITRSGGGQPGKENFTAQIRGATSVNGAPVLVIIDGVVGDLSLLNPDDIATISVLKDGAAAAIYGARAAGGVILATTKKGSSRKLQVNFTSQYSTDKLFNLPNRVNSWEEGDMENKARVNSGGARLWSDDQLAWMHKDTFRVGSGGQDYEYYFNHNYLNDLVKKTQSNFTNNLSVSGGTQKSLYRVSLGTYGKQGILKVGPDDFQRINTRLSYLTRFNDIFSFDANIGYVHSTTNSPSIPASGDYGAMMQLYTARSIYPWFVPNTDHWSMGTIGSTPSVYGNLRDGGGTKEINDNFTGVFTFTADQLVKGLKLTGVYAPGLMDYRYTQNYRNWERWGISTIMRTENPAGANAPNQLTKARQTVTTNNLQFLADYDFTFLPEKHKIHVLGGYQFENLKTDSTSATAKKLSSNEVFSLNLGDPTMYSAVEGTDEWANLSYFGRLNYSFDNKYLFEANVRVDGSSKLAPSVRWSTFPSFSAGWIVSNEEWYKNITALSSTLNTFKLRGSWGQLGNNAGFGNYDYTLQLVSGNYYPFNNQRSASYYQKTLTSPERTWEIVQTTNLGTNLGLFRNRLNFSFDYYWKQTKKMLMPLVAPSTMGIILGNYNLADMKSWGWELEGSWRDKLLDGKLNYSIAFNLSDNLNKVTNYKGTTIIGAGSGTNSNVIEGMPLNSIWGYVANGYFQTNAEAASYADESTVNNKVAQAGDIKYMDIDKSGAITPGAGTLKDHGDLQYLGTANPRFNYGVNLSVDYGGFDLSVFFQGVGQRKMLINPLMMMPYGESWRQPWDIHLNYWSPENPNAAFPRPFLGNKQNREPSTFWVQNAAYLRLKNLQFGYTLPVELTQKIKLNKVRVYFTGQDLWEVSKMWIKYFDPEEPNNSSFTYPMYRSYAFGINIGL